jgi:hypothetical protein
MRKLMLPLVILFVFASFVACKKPWSKDYLTKKCNTDFKKRNDTAKYFDSTQLVQLCDCIADKMVTRYKSEADADKDSKGAEEIGRDCALTVLKK